MKKDNPINHDILLNEFKLNARFTLKNKVVMAPMTRAKATEDLVPTAEMAEYYARRADCGLIITEGTVINSDALGCRYVPGIFNAMQINHWKQVTDKVHRNDGLIFMQIWHVGRVSHPAFLGGKLPIGPSDAELKGKVYRSPDLIYGKSRAATLEEIKQIINLYAEAAQNALKAGFDGVEIHGANGYLIDQFLHYHSNQRDDEYGGNPENMARFAIEVVRACGQAIGYDRVGLRISPGAYLNQIDGDNRDFDVFQYLLEKLSQFNIAYVHTGNFDDTKTFKELNDLTMSEFIRSYYQGTTIGCGSYTLETAAKAIANNAFDLIALGRPFIANPDLLDRIRNNNTLQSYDVGMLDNLY